jgi:hypothetical protein
MIMCGCKKCGPRGHTQTFRFTQGAQQGVPGHKAKDVRGAKDVAYGSYMSWRVRARTVIFSRVRESNARAGGGRAQMGVGRAQVGAGALRWGAGALRLGRARKSGPGARAAGRARELVAGHASFGAGACGEGRARTHWVGRALCWCGRARWWGALCILQLLKGLGTTYINPLLLLLLRGLEH